MKGFLGEFGMIKIKLNVFYDRQSAIHLAKNPSYHIKTKHIYVKYHFVRHIIDEGGVLLEKVHTQKHCGEMFTKLVTLEKLRWCITYLGLKKKVTKEKEKGMR